MGLKAGKRPPARGASGTALPLGRCADRNIKRTRARKSILGIGGYAQVLRNEVELAHFAFVSWIAVANALRVLKGASISAHIDALFAESGCPTT